VARAGFLALVLLQPTPEGRAAFAAVRAEMAGQGTWTETHAGSDLIAWTHGGLPWRTLGRAGVLFGRYRPYRPPAQPAPSMTPDASAKALLDEGWGEYVALIRDPAKQDLAILRDPSGLLDALAWSRGPELRVVTSDYRRTPERLRPAHPFLNWDRIAAWLAAPPIRSHEPLFDEVEGVAPGELLTLSPEHAPRRVLAWGPGRFAAAAVRAEPAETRAELVRRLDLSLDGLLADRGPVLVRLSGGIDSSIVAGTIGALGRSGQVAAWLNRYTRRPEGDERAFARAVTDRLGVPLTASEKPLQPIRPEDLAELADAVWPAINGVDTARDREEVARLEATGAEAIVTGDGGDGLFFKLATPLVLVDAVRQDGWNALRSPLLVETAQRLRTSVWSVLARAWRGRRERAADAGGGLGFVTPAVAELGATLRHPWLDDALAYDLPPAKLLQVQPLANYHTFHGDSRAHRLADPMFPILAQPVVEHLLSVPIRILTGDGGDRRLAREAFADRLPRCVAERRQKGVMPAYFSQVVAASAAELRPFLLDGCLAETGLLDRAALAAALDPAELIRTGRSSEVLWLASAEAWVRYWQTRVPDSQPSRL
jgi:asparagine synthase (glutamine-hydrolysing)